MTDPRGQAEQTDAGTVEALAAVIGGPSAYARTYVSNPAVREAIARLVLASDWLAAHTAAAKHEGARAVVEAVETVLPIGPRPHVDLHSIGAYDLATTVRAAARAAAEQTGGA